MLKGKIIFTILALILLTKPCFAQHPRLVESTTTPIESPQIAQAYYGELKGQPHYFEIDSQEKFNLYVGLQLPDLPNIDKDVSAQIFKINHDGKKSMFILDGQKHQWPRYFEKFAGNFFFTGPELKNETYTDNLPHGIKAKPGKYQIKIYSPDNKGKYILAIGDRESFPPNEVIRTIVTLPKLQVDFFNKPAYSAYFNYTGLFLFGFLIMIVMLIIYLLWLIRCPKNEAFL